MKENKTKMKAMGEDNSRSWAWIIFILIVFFVSLAFAVKPSNETSSYFEATGDMTGQIKVKGVQLKIYQDIGEGYKDVTKDGFDLDTNYFVTDRSYNYDMIIKNDDKATVKAEEYYLRWWFSANIDGTEYDITDYCSVDTAFVYKQDDSDGKTRFYSVNGYNSNVISAQTQLTFLSHINFKGQYDSSTGSYGSILDKEASGSKVKITAHIEGSLSAYSIVKPSVKVYDSEGNITQETTLADGQTTITLPRVGYGSKEIDGETLYFQGWLKNGVVAQVYTPNETVEVQKNDVFTPYYAQDPDYSDFVFEIDSVTGEYILAGANENITTATIPALIEGSVVSVIFDGGFYEYQSLQTVKLPQTITSIGEMAFAYCSNLTSITIPDGVTSIGPAAFFQCLSLTEITIPDSLIEMPWAPFAECVSLSSINVSENNPAFIVVDGVLFDKGLTRLIIYSAQKSDTSYIIPNSVTDIDPYAFAGCYKLTSITIPNGVTSIEDGVFYLCRNLTSINIPNSVTYIGDMAFCACWNLRTIEIPNSVTYIGNEAFDECESLQKITLGDNVEYLGSGAFYGCLSLSSATIGNGITHIKDSTFAGCTSLTSITIPNSVTSIGPYVFSDCSNLETITFENTSGWYMTTSSSYTGGSAIDVSNPTTNATNMKSNSGSWRDKYLYRVDE